MVSHIMAAIDIQGVPELKLKRVDSIDHAKN